VADILGEGTSGPSRHRGDTYWRVVESVLAGVWRLEGSTADGQTFEWIESDRCRNDLTAAADRRAPRSTSRSTRRRCNERAAAAGSNCRNARGPTGPARKTTVINFTLLPITEVDTEVLTSVLGQDFRCS